MFPADTTPDPIFSDGPPDPRTSKAPRQETDPCLHNLPVDSDGGETTTPSSIPSGNDGRRVLLLDSDPSHAQSLVNSLRPAGYVVTPYTHTRDALQALRLRDFDFVAPSSCRPGDWFACITAFQDAMRRKKNRAEVMVWSRIYRGPQDRLEATAKGVGWCMCDNVKSLIQELEFLVAERKQVSARGFHFRIWHRLRIPGTACMPGEEVLAIFLVFRGREYQLRLSAALLLLADFLLRNSRFAQTATQISNGMHADGFYAEHGANGRRQRIWHIPRSAIREDMKRLKRALALVFGEANVGVDPADVLVTQETVSNQVLYRWKCRPEVVHIDSTAANDQPLLGGMRRWDASATDLEAQ